MNGDRNELWPRYISVPPDKASEYLRMPAFAVNWCKKTGIVLVAGGGGTKGTGIRSGITVNRITSKGILCPFGYLDTHDKLAVAIAAHPTDSVFACAIGEFTYIIQWDSKTSTLITVERLKSDFSEDNPYQACVAFDPLGTMLAGGGEDRIVRTFRYPSFGRMNQFKHHANVIQSISFNCSGNLMAVTSKERICSVWHSDHTKMWTLSYRDMEFRGCAFSLSDEYTLFTWLNSPSRGSILAMWDVSSGTIIKLVNLDDKSAVSGRMSHDGSLLAVATVKNNCTIYTLSTSTLSIIGKQRVSHDFPQTGMDFSPNDDKIVSVSADMSHEIIMSRSSTGIIWKILFLLTLMTVFYGAYEFGIFAVLFSQFSQFKTEIYSFSEFGKRWMPGPESSKSDVISVIDDYPQRSRSSVDDHFASETLGHSAIARPLGLTENPFQEDTELRSEEPQNAQELSSKPQSTDFQASEALSAGKSVGVRGRVSISETELIKPNPGHPAVDDDSSQKNIPVITHPDTAEESTTDSMKSAAHSHSLVDSPSLENFSPSNQEVRASQDQDTEYSFSVSASDSPVNLGVDTVLNDIGTETAPDDSEPSVNADNISDTVAIIPDIIISTSNLDVSSGSRGDNAPLQTSAEVEVEPQADKSDSTVGLGDPILRMDEKSSNDEPSTTENRIPDHKDPSQASPIMSSEQGSEAGNSSVDGGPSPVSDDASDGAEHAGRSANLNSQAPKESLNDEPSTDENDRQHPVSNDTGSEDVFQGSHLTETPSGAPTDTKIDAGTSEGDASYDTQPDDHQVDERDSQRDSDDSGDFKNNSVSDDADVPEDDSS